MQPSAPRKDQILYATSKFLGDYKKVVSAFLDLRKVLKLQGDFGDIEKLATEVSVLACYLQDSLPHLHYVCRGVCVCDRVGQTLCS